MTLLPLVRLLFASSNHLVRRLGAVVLVMGLTLVPAHAGSQPATASSGIFDDANNCINYKTTLPSVTGTNFVVYSPASVASVARTVAAIIRTKDVLKVYERGLHIPSLAHPGQTG